MNRNRAGVILAALLLAGFPSAAYAHTGQAGMGFLSGLLHPVFGLDHFLAMLSVGIVSAQLGGKRVFTIPATFVLAMIVGAVIGVHGTQWPLSEAGIAVSVVVLGIAIATVTDHVKSWPVMLAVALFGSLHGHAHGLELPRSADPVYYAAGFVTSTAAIHHARDVREPAAPHGIGNGGDGVDDPAGRAVCRIRHEIRLHRRRRRHGGRGCRGSAQSGTGRASPAA
jgi:urease accessory protein